MFPGVGQPVGPVANQASAPSARALPDLPEPEELPQEASLLEMRNLLADNRSAAARDSGGDYFEKGHALRPTCGDSDTKILGTIAANAQALADMGHPCDLQGRLERGSCGNLLRPITGKTPVSPDIIPADMRTEIDSTGHKGKDYTWTEVRLCAVNVNLATDPLVRQAKEKQAYEDVQADLQSEQAVVDELKQSVETKKRKIVELQGDVDREEEAIENKQAHADKVKQAADELLGKSDELFGITWERATKKIIGANCVGSQGATRVGYLKPMGLTPDSHNHKAVKFDKVVDALVHTAVGNDLVRKLTAHRKMMEWAADMPEEKWAELVAMRAGAGAPGA